MKSLFGTLAFVLCTNSFAASKPPLIGKAAVAVCSQHRATDIGKDILNQGDNAIDTTVAMGYALFCGASLLWWRRFYADLISGRHLNLDQFSQERAA